MIKEVTMQTSRPSSGQQLLLNPCSEIPMAPLHLASHVQPCISHNIVVRVSSRLSSPSNVTDNHSKMLPMKNHQWPL